MLPVFVVVAEEAGLYAPEVSLGRSIGSRVCAAGGFGGYRGGFLLAENASGREAEVAAALLGAADDIASAHGADVLSLQFLPPSQAELAVATGLVAREELVFQESEVLVAVPTGGLDEHVVGLSQKRRATVRRDLRAFEASGCRLTESRLSEAFDFAPRLFVQLKEAHRQPLSEAEAAEWLDAQARALDDVSVVFAARDPAGAVVAYSLAYVWDDTIYLRAVGLDHEPARADGAYFEATYYAPLRYAARNGLRAVHLGIKALRPKVLRGGALHDLCGFFRCPGGRTLPPELVAEASERRRREIREELGPLA
jgi:predicted N-acyltransferase